MADKKPKSKSRRKSNKHWAHLKSPRTELYLTSTKPAGSEGKCAKQKGKPPQDMHSQIKTRAAASRLDSLTLIQRPAESTESSQHVFADPNPSSTPADKTDNMNGDSPDRGNDNSGFSDSNQGSGDVSSMNSGNKGDGSSQLYGAALLL